MNKQEFISAIEKIGWSVEGEWPNYRLYDNKGANTSIRIDSHGISIKNHNGANYAIFASYESIAIQQTSNLCISIHSKYEKDPTSPSLFIQLYSH